MVKVKLAKFQGPIAPPRYQEPAQIVQEIPPTHPYALSWDSMRLEADFSAHYAEERDADRLEVSP